MARVIAFASNKGGTGKTVVVANLGAAMAKLGQKVMALDADIMMANLGLITGLEGQKTTLHEVLAGEAPISKAVYSGPEGLKIVPCGVSLNGIQRANPDGLKKVVQDLSLMFDILLVDSPSGLDRDAIAALQVAQELIVVTTPDISSLSNALKLKVVAESLGVKPTGVIITRTISNGLEIPKEEIASVLELPVLGVVPEDEAVRRSAALGESVLTQSPKSTAAVEFKKLAAAIATARPKS